MLNSVKAALPSFREVVPEGVDVQLEFDQTGYVTNAINGLAFEAALGAFLTGLMVLLFLRDWRSAFIVVTTIPLALLSAVVFLWAAGQTINIMTLGGLALGCRHPRRRSHRRSGKHPHANRTRPAARPGGG